MTPPRRASTKRLLGRLKGRADIGRERALSELGAGLPVDDAAALADLIEEEFSVPIGLLRPDDRPDVLFASFPFANPFTWLWAEAALEDGVSEISLQLKRRGATADRPPQTFAELFEVWCRVRPT